MNHADLNHRLTRLLADKSLPVIQKRARVLKYMGLLTGGNHAHPEKDILTGALCTDLADLFSVPGEGADIEFATRLLIKAANGGHGPAQARLAIRLLKGDGVARNPAAGVRWLRKAASKGHIPSQRRLGICLQIGLGTELDTDEAEHWLVSAARNRDIPAAYRLGVCKRRGTGTRRHIQRARFLLTLAVKGGNARAAYYLHGIDPDPTDSDDPKPSDKDMHLLLRAAKSGIPEAQLELGRHLFLDNEAEKAEGMAWMLKAATAGHLKAQSTVALLGIDEPDIISAHELEKWTAIAKYNYARFEHPLARIAMDEPDLADIQAPDPESYSAEPACGLVDAARAGDADAQYLLSQCVAAPEVDAMPNEALATYWLEAAAAQDHTDALYEIARRRYDIFDFNGDDPITDQAFDEITALLRKIAPSGHTKAQQLLARILVNQDCHKYGAEALHWLRKSADLGNVDAMALLGQWLTDGTHVEANPDEGMKWLILAADRGDNDARERLEK